MNRDRPNNTINLSLDIIMNSFTIQSSQIFGLFNRYRLDKATTRSGDIEYFLINAETKDDLGLPSVIGQSSNLGSLINGLSDEDIADLAKKHK